MDKLIRFWLLVTFVFIVLRVFLEEVGAGDQITQLLSVSILPMVVVIHFGWHIGSNKLDRGFWQLIKSCLIYGIGSRVMLAISYVCAYLFGFSSQRFFVGGATLSESALAIVGGLVFGIIATVIIGIVLGGIAMLIAGRRG